MTSILVITLLWAVPAAEAARPPGAGGGGTGGGGSGTKGYVGVNLGALPGDKYSDAWDVNAAGLAVGRSYGYKGELAGVVKAFYHDGATMTRLMPATGPAYAGDSPWEAEARGISSGGASVAIVVGVEMRTICTDDPEHPGDPTYRTCTFEQHAVVWTPSAGGFAAARLDDDDRQGHAFGINDAGSWAVGSSGGSLGTVWSRDRDSGAWTSRIIQESAFPLSDLAPPFEPIPGHDIRIVGTAWGVNDDGVVIGDLTWYDTTAADACEQTDSYPCPVDSARRAYVFFDHDLGGNAAGTGRVLPTPPGLLESAPYAISNVTNGGFYVAGWAGSTAGDGTDQGIRWAIKLGASAMDPLGDVTVETLSQLAWAEGVNEPGVVAGTRNSRPDRRGNVIQTAMLWKPLEGYVPLKPPKGGSDSTARGMAGTSPTYVVGEANVSGVWQAARWVIP